MSTKDTNLSRRGFLTGTGRTAAGIAGLAAITPMLASQKAEAQPPGFGPSVYDTAERDWRLDRVRAMMKEQGVDALIVPHLSGSMYINYSNYFAEAGSMNPGAILVPDEGEMIGFGIGGSMMPGGNPWITNVVPFGEPVGESLVKKLKELGYENKTIGVVGSEAGVTGTNEFAFEGIMPYATLTAVVNGLPKAEFVDVTGPVTEVMLVRSEKGLEQSKKAALKAEEMQQLIVDTMKVGIDPKVVYSTVSEFLIMNGATSDVQALILMGPPRKGQVIACEYGFKYQGGYAQVTMTMVMGDKLPAAAEKTYATTKAVYEKSLEVIKPGKTFGEVLEPLHKIIDDSGLRHGFPLIHSLEPITLVGRVGAMFGPPKYQPTRGPEVVLQPNMTLSLESGSRTSMMDEVRLGGTGQVTENGFENWNTLGTELQFIDA